MLIVLQSVILSKFCINRLCKSVMLFGIHGSAGERYYCMLGKQFSGRHFEIFSYLSRNVALTAYTNCHLWLEKVCMKCQGLFSEDNKNNYN